MNQDFQFDVADDEVIVSTSGHVGCITLNNPKNLNALSVEMVRIISFTLKRWESDKSIHAVLFKAVDGRAFCSGGDMKAVYKTGMEYRRGSMSAKASVVFFAEEYALNKQIANYPKPSFALMDGITMGGGFGLAGHCTHRIVTEKVEFAMPEVNIGFFPDVGSAYHLLKAPHSYGRYLALTGLGIQVGDMLEAGLADYYISSSWLDDFVSALSQISSGDFSTVLKEYGGAAPKSETLAPNQTQIETAFSADSMVKVGLALQEDSGSWAHDTLQRLKAVSPISLCVTMEHLNRLVGKTVDDVLAQDFTLVQHFMNCPDFFEGVRAALVEKDRKPSWENAGFNSDAGFEFCDDKMLQSYFEDTGYNLSDVQIFDA